MRRFVVAFVAASTFNLASMAHAADLPRSQPVYKAVTAPLPMTTDWSGFYVGGQIGYGWAQSSGTHDAGGTFFPVVPYTVDSHGILGGVHAGYNHRMNAMILGIEADIEAASMKGLSEVPAAGTLYYFNANIDTLGSVRARIGWSRDRWMIYATGGVAFGNVETPPLDTLSGWRTGWTVGGGIERAALLLGNNWSTRVEYRYTDLGRVSYDTAFGTTDDNTLAFHAIRVGLSYRFNR